MISGYIIGNPGAYYSRIREDLDLKNGTFRYHIGVLLRERIIKKKNDGMKVRFFPFSYTVGEIYQYANATNKERAYLLFLKEKKVSTVKEIAHHFSVTKQTVYIIIKSLKEKEFIFYSEDGKIAKQPIVLIEKGYREIEQFKAKNGLL